MKSFLKYVTCCGEATAVDVEEASRNEEAEFIIVVPSPLRETKRQKSRRHGAAKPALGDQNRKKYSRLHWQPALSAISENKVATESELVSSVVGGGGPEKMIVQPKLERSNTGNKKAVASSKVYDSNYSDNSWREGSRSPLMPSLSPPIFAF